MEDIFLHELMTTNVTSVDIKATLDDVLEIMRNHAYSCMVIVDNKKPAGIITERDLVRVLYNVLNKKPDKPLLVKDLMTKHPICIKESNSLYEALVIIQTRNIRHLPVTDDEDNLIGLVTQTDIAKAHFTAVERHRQVIDQEIKERTREMVEANEELRALALQDGLLGIGNRRAMEVDLNFTHANSRRYGREYTCVLIDVDYFKPYNDFYGHQAGDEALQKVSNCLNSSIRGSDRLYRYGGEEFLLLLPETAVHDATIAVQRLLVKIEKMALRHEKSPLKIVTVSAGLAPGANKDTWEKGVKEADRFLYDAKAAGRNQMGWDVEATSPPSSENVSGNERRRFSQ